MNSLGANRGSWLGYVPYRRLQRRAGKKVTAGGCPGRRETGRTSGRAGRAETAEHVAIHDGRGNYGQEDGRDNGCKTVYSTILRTSFFFVTRVRRPPSNSTWQSSIIPSDASAGTSMVAVIVLPSRAIANAS